MERRDYVILTKVLSEISVAESLMSDTTISAFLESELLRRAICMTVINIGELVKNLSEDTRKASPYIPWKAIAGFRDIAAHKYQTLKMEDVYETVSTDFPVLKQQITELLK